MTDSLCQPLTVLFAFQRGYGRERLASMAEGQKPVRRPVANIARTHLDIPVSCVLPFLVIYATKSYKRGTREDAIPASQVGSSSSLRLR